MGSDFIVQEILRYQILWLVMIKDGVIISHMSRNYTYYKFAAERRISGANYRITKLFISNY
jgi:hypothetical protein